MDHDATGLGPGCEGGAAVTVTISPSALGNYFVCPAKFRYSREYRWLGPEPDYFKLGHEVHGLMDGSLTAAQVRPAAVLQAKRLLALEQSLGLKPLRRELSQSVVLCGLTLNRRVDVAALDVHDESPVIVDYKTASSPWETVTSEYGPVAPKGMGFQPISYLLPPTEGENPYGETWAWRMEFLVAPTRGNVQRFPYYWNEADYSNLVDAVEQVAEAIQRVKFPKVRGYECGRCDFAQRCFQAPGWERNYSATGTILSEED